MHILMIPLLGVTILQPDLSASFQCLGITTILPMFNILISNKSETWQLHAKVGEPVSKIKRYTEFLLKPDFTLVKLCLITPHLFEFSTDAFQ